MNRFVRTILFLIAMGLVALALALFWRSYQNLISQPAPVAVAELETAIPSAVPTVNNDHSNPGPSPRTDEVLPSTNTPKPPFTKTPSPDLAILVTQDPNTEPTNTRPLFQTVTPTSLPQPKPSLAFTPGSELIPESAPTPVATFEVPEAFTNILLLGSDTPLDNGTGRTDTIIIVAINHDGPTASMLSLPRDLYVYIPGWKLGRINTALTHGATINYPGGAVKQLTDTILYNFGIPIHYYAQVDFGGFMQAVDIIGGVEVAVSCKLEDWRLKSPDLDPNNEDNWELFTLEPGIYHMDGDLALWYARSRKSTSDFDRGRRQQQLLRMMLNDGVDLNLLPQAPNLWTTYKDTVRTDLDIGRLLQLATIAPAIRQNGIQHLYMVGDQLQPYVVPSTSAQVQIPIWEEVHETIRRLFLPPALNKAYRPPMTVEIINASGNPDLALLAADNLERYGFEPHINQSAAAGQRSTNIEYFAQNMKGSFDWLLSWVMAKKTADVQLVTDTTYPYNYLIVLGSEYDPCRPQLFAPQIFLDQ